MRSHTSLAVVLLGILSMSRVLSERLVSLSAQDASQSAVVRPPVGARAGVKHDGALRILSVKLMADEEYRSAHPDWDKSMREALSEASKVYEQLSKVRLVADSTGKWESNNSAVKMQELWYDLSNKVPLDQADILMGFTAQHTGAHVPTKELSVAGIAYEFDRCAIIRSVGQRPETIIAIVLHELGHVLGLVHVKDDNSFMNPHAGGTVTTRLDSSNLTILGVTREMDVGLGVAGLGDEMLQGLQSTYSKLAEATPDETGIKTCLATVLFRQRSKDALEVAKSAVSQSPDDVEARRVLVRQYHLLGDHAAAEGEAREIIKRVPADSSAYCDLGWALILRGKHSDAEEICREAARIKPHSGGAHSILGFSLLGQDRKYEAIREFQIVVGLQPQDPIAHMNLAISLSDVGRLEEAIQEYSNVVSLDPRNAIAHYNLGGIYGRHRRLKDAEAELRQAVSIDPGYAEAHNNLGAALLDQGKVPDAEAEFREAIRIQPSEANAHLNLGLLLGTQGKTSEAVVEARECIKISPGDASAHLLLGQLLFRQQDLPEAEKSLREAIRIVPNSLLAHVCLTELLYRKGDYAEAWKEVVECRRRNGKLDSEFLKELTSKMPEPK